MLIQAAKEHVVCAELNRDDVFFYYTTSCVHITFYSLPFYLSQEVIRSYSGWMMWNFLVAGLYAGCTLVLYDGSPLRDPAYLWKLVDDLGITIFGTSAKYLEQLAVRQPTDIILGRRCVHVISYVTESL
jgi:acetoacetyl-CoA synthetase